jgi:two-component system response regulator AtoC
MVQAGTFREDLYFRLKVFVIRTPALRERPEDIIPLAEHFISRLNSELKRNVTRIPMEYIKILKAYDWPGNVRELENLLGRAIILSRAEVLELEGCWFQKAEAAAAPASPGERSELKSLNSIEKEHILRVLDHTEGNYGEACKILGITRPTLRKKINDYGIKEFIEDSLKA